MNPSLYIHIPACLRKCDYCDFFSLPGLDGAKLTAIVHALASEIAEKERVYAPAGWKTIYIGGGTPSLLSAGDIGILCRNLGTDGEWTIEANPEDVSAPWLGACASAGINRLSLGIQSMDDAVLSGVGRRGSRKSNLAALALVRDRWEGRVSADLIAGLPGQTLTGLESDIGEIMSFKPDHISLYSLTVEEGTPLGERMAGNGTPSEEEGNEAADLWIAGRDLLEKSGYRQYEVSNFARNGAESAHNMTYWHLDTYVGAGPGAAGTVNTLDTATRFTNTTDVEKWLSNPADSFDTESLGRRECIREVLLMGMRLASGISRKRFKDRFDQDILDLVGKTARRWEERGLLETGPDRIALDRRGLLFLNRFLSDCMEELC